MCLCVCGSRFIADASVVQDVRSVFTGLYSLGEDHGEASTQRALLHPELYVLKPQREGGGRTTRKTVFQPCFLLCEKTLVALHACVCVDACLCILLSDHISVCLM